MTAIAKKAVPQARKPRIKRFAVKRAQRKSFFHRIKIPERGAALYEKLHEGLGFHVYVDLSDFLNIQKKDFNAILNFAPATVNRRKSGTFTLDESDKLYRLTEITNSAIELFEGDEDKARTWLNKAVKGLSGKRPIDMLSTSAETEAVLELIGRLEHGVFS